MGPEARLRALGEQLGRPSPSRSAAAAGSVGVELWTKAGADGKSVGDCPFSHACAAALKLKGVAFTYRPATPATKPDWLLDAGGSMPALRDNDNGTVVVDSAEILKHIDARGSAPTLGSPDSDVAQKHTADVLGAVAGCICAGTDEAAAASEALDAQLAKIEALLAASDGAWLGGDTLCAADCALLPKLHHMRVAATHYSHYSPPDLPLLAAYMRAGLDGEHAACKPDYPDEEILFGWAQEGAVSPGVAEAVLRGEAPAAYADPAPQRYTLHGRASEIDTNAREHPELNFVFTNADGKPTDLQHATVDTRVPSEGKLVIWLMAHNAELFDRLASYGFHAIQPHYANAWFGGLPEEVRDSGVDLGKIRLEAAVGEDYSPHVSIPKPDSVAGRSLQMVRWLSSTHPQGNWEQFLSEDGQDLRWESVILSGISHGSTTSARFAKHQEVARVVLFSGPRDQLDDWHGFPSATPTERYFAFTHVLDGGWPEHYHRSWKMLGLEDHGTLQSVDGSDVSMQPPYANSRTLTTSADVGGDANVAHTTVVPGGTARRDEYGRYIYEDVWRYMFTHPCVSA